MLITNGEPDTRRRVSPVPREGVGNLLFDMKEQGAFSLPYELLKSDTARLMLANSEFLILLNQASTDREELAKLLNISDNQLSYITNVSAGHGLIRCSGNIVPFENAWPRGTKLYQLMSTAPVDKPGSMKKRDVDLQ